MMMTIISRFLLLLAAVILAGVCARIICESVSRSEWEIRQGGGGGFAGAHHPSP